VTAQSAGLRRTAGLRREGVPAAFDTGAFAYDHLVGANPGYHRHLRLSARRMRLPDEGRGLRLLDAGCGTGASTAALLAVAPQAEITAIDASGAMLDRARAKRWPASVTFTHTPVEKLADAGIFGPLDGAARFRRRLGDAGFTGVHSETVPGWQQGIVHTFLASRPKPGLG
jgi:SAM-dependent methyltransferase